MYVKSPINSGCPAGYKIINDKTTCFTAYDALQTSNGWSGVKDEGFWGHVIQCGVHLKFNNGEIGNTAVHFKNDGVDGKIYPGEEWVHLCERTGTLNLKNTGFLKIQNCDFKDLLLAGVVITDIVSAFSQTKRRLKIL